MMMMLLLLHKALIIDLICGELMLGFCGMHKYMHACENKQIHVWEWEQEREPSQILQCNCQHYFYLMHKDEETQQHRYMNLLIALKCFYLFIFLFFFQLLLLVFLVWLAHILICDDMWFLLLFFIELKYIRRCCTYCSFISHNF